MQALGWRNWDEWEGGGVGEEGERGCSQRVREGGKKCCKGGPREMSMLKAGRDQSYSCSWR